MLRRSHYGDGDWYDDEYVHVGGDRAAVAEWAGARQVLELACGTGRLTFPMAQAGARVVGVDLEPAMLERAERKRAILAEPIRSRVRFVLGDMRSLELDARFERVVVGLNALMHMLTDADLAQALTTVRRHLAPDGRALLDVFAPLPVDHDDAARVDPQQMIHGGHRWEVTENRSYDPRQQLQTLRFFYRRLDEPEPSWFSELRLRVIYPRELDSWLDRAGLEVVGDWDDIERTQSFTGAGGRRVIEVRNRA